MVALLGLAASAPACGDSGTVVLQGEEDDLTSLTARSRELTFEGIVYVDSDASDGSILKAARSQSQTAFGALLAMDISVESRELKDIDPQTFKKRKVKVIDTDKPGDRGRTKLEVRYTYRDNAVVPVALSRRTSLALAVLGPDYDAQKMRVVKSCTNNDKEAREDAEGGLLWYDFNPSRPSCQAAITEEQNKLETDGAKLEDPKNEVTQSRVDRLYVPATMSLGASTTTTGATYPEYDRLFSGGVAPGKLTLGVITGRLDHHHVEAALDDGYFEWLDMLGVVFQEHPRFALTKIEPEEDLSTVTVAGRKLEGLKFADFIQWTVFDTGYPTGLSAADKKELRLKIGKKLDNHWLTFELPVKVTVGNAAPTDFTIALNTLFGSEEEKAPFKRVVKTSDVFIYNGHSYIGAGPLDPANFKSSDFPPSYQLFFIDGCVSYNYYNEGYFLRKEGGAKMLDTITNGIEAPQAESGSAEGLFISKLIGGSQPSYQTLLKAAKATDSMRVVDGEIDNKFAPTRTSIRVEPR